MPGGFGAALGRSRPSRQPVLLQNQRFLWKGAHFCPRLAHPSPSSRVFQRQGFKYCEKEVGGAPCGLFFPLQKSIFWGWFSQCRPVASPRVSQIGSTDLNLGKNNPKPPCNHAIALPRIYNPYRERPSCCGRSARQMGGYNATISRLFFKFSSLSGEICFGEDIFAGGIAVGWGRAKNWGEKPLIRGLWVGIASEGRRPLPKWRPVPTSKMAAPALFQNGSLALRQGQREDGCSLLLSVGGSG